MDYYGQFKNFFDRRKVMNGIRIPNIGEQLILKADGAAHTVTSIVWSSVFPSGVGIECDGDGYQGVFAAGKRRTGLRDLSQYEFLPD
jgi:hypothetical protein